MASQTLDKISLSHLPYYQHRALMRLQLSINAEIHKRLSEIITRLAPIIRKSEQDDGKLDSNDIPVILRGFAPIWGEFTQSYQSLFDETRTESANIGMASFAKNHQRYIYGHIPKPERGEFSPLEENNSAAFESLSSERDRILKSVSDRVYGDGFNLSQRIWNFDQKGRQGIENQIRTLVLSENATPLSVIKGLEEYLGANANCPRWTRKRLMNLVPKERLKSRTGLLSGNPCLSKGISYNATRLIRNEIQIIHHAMYDELTNRIPWIEEERIVLSPLHPPIGCVCEEVVVGGRDGKGIYPKGTITLPLHVQCMCLKISVLPDPVSFSNRLNNWLTYRSSDAGINEYADFLNQDRATLPKLNLSSLANPFLFWLFADADKLLSF